MKQLLFLSTILFLASCKPAAEVTSGSSSSNKTINEEAPFVWKKKTFPKEIRISSAFEESEKTAIRDMAAKWKSSTGNKNWFSFGEEVSTGHNLNSPDGIMGVYKATSWPEDIDDSALAITQLFGRRYNIGDANEYVAIEHADIVVNYKPGPYAFTFDSIDETPLPIDQGYDLRTVILHEMGHFLGLQHIPSYYDREPEYDDMDRDDYKAMSVMYPSISSIEEKRDPQPIDINTLLAKYPSGSGATYAVVGSNHQPQEDDQGKNVRIVIELRRDGECVHKENGAIFKRHSIKLK